MNIEELKAQVSALQIQPGTVVVLSLNLDTSDNWLTAKAMAEQLRHAVPQENPLLVLQRPAEVQALDEAQMRELGWVRANSAVQDVVAERQRQVSAEGWTPEHDDEHADGSMADAAGCYALHAHDTAKDGAKNFVPAWWPWEPEWYKRSSPRGDLVKAGALILAEIERLDRASSSQG